MTYEALWHRLIPHYETDEAKAIVRWVLDVRFGLSWADILCGKVTELSANDQAELEKIILRLEKGEPVQYIIGVADFCGRQFHVEPGVLIPRPETEELCRMVIKEKEISQKGQSPLCEILDIGTGSGCIAITLALELPDAHVTAWDISDVALRIAQENATALGVNVSFEHRDALNIPSSLLPSPSKYSSIVSNPPYICEKEKSSMERNVLEHEPHLALFVPDDDPLRFYRAIAQYAIEALAPRGSLFFEINPLYADDLAHLLSMMSCYDISLLRDQFGKRRFLKATKI
ncbi:MAG: peptide chain release factor N(5)-glutamine methyltransferase [Prevotella sp.]|nr:peptide chain release factor N(5)-glutamine methyltransferase [Prevotella sp.]